MADIEQTLAPFAPHVMVFGQRWPADAWTSNHCVKPPDPMCSRPQLRHLDYIPDICGDRPKLGVIPIVQACLSYKSRFGFGDGWA